MTTALRLIILLGQTGVGKSSFITTLTGLKSEDINHSITPKYNDTVRHLIWSQDVVLVDTPGFNAEDDYYKPLDDLIAWANNLNKIDDLRNSKVGVGGFLYLFEDGQHDLPLRKQLQGESKIAQRTVYVMTKPDRTLRGPIIPPECVVHDNTESSAKSIVDTIPVDYIDVKQLLRTLKDIRKSLKKKESPRNIFGRLKSLFGL